MMETKAIGRAIKETRKSLGLTQKRLAMISGSSPRFIIELEQGKPTCQLGKVLLVLQTLGIGISLEPPFPEKERQHE